MGFFSNTLRGIGIKELTLLVTGLYGCVTTNIGVTVLYCIMELYNNIEGWFLSFPIGWQMILIFAPLYLYLKWSKAFKKNIIDN